MYRFLLFSFLLFAAACQPETTGRQPLFFRYNQSSGITSLDPAFAKDQANIWAVNQLFSTLVQLDDRLQVQPCVAKSWAVSPDGQVYTFHLRSDVYFHDDACFPRGKGTQVTAKDVAYSFSRLIDTLTASTGAWLFNDHVAELQSVS